MVRETLVQAFLRPGLAELVSRLTAGVFGGYGLATSVAVLLSYVLPMSRADAVATGILASFAVYTAAILWAFAVRSHRRLWLGLLAPGGVCAALAWLSGPVPAP